MDQIEMLAAELMETRADLKRHVVGCEEGQRKNTDVIQAMNLKLDKVERTVNGYQHFISGSWRGVGRLIAAIIVAVSAAVGALMYQNAYFHRDTAGKVEHTAATLATVTAAHNETVESAQKKRDDEIIRLLKQRK